VGQQEDTATAAGVFDGVTYDDTDVAYYVGHSLSYLPFIAIP
jgi:hypothetical protein